MAHCAAIDEKAAAPAEDSKNVEKRGLHLGDYHSHHHHEHIKTVTIEKKVPVHYTVTKHVPYTVEKKVSISYDTYLILKSTLQHLKLSNKLILKN